MKCLVALSGGVDSALAACLLKSQGHEVEGVYMRTWMNEADKIFAADCPWEADRESAREVAEHLKIPFRVINMIDVYKEKVVSYLVNGYGEGLTPNPDIMCNKEVKFGTLLQYAEEEGFDYLATGHYVRKAVKEGKEILLEGLDVLKDQSYFLAMVNPVVLKKTLFPIGHLNKSEVRQLAKEYGLPNAERKDSQGICFLGKVSIQEFLDHYLPQETGPIINLEGKILGTHKGLHRYTIGQRRGIGIPSNADFENYVVVKKDLENQALIVAFDHPGTPYLYTKGAVLMNFNWFQEPIEEGVEVMVRVRYRDPAIKARVQWDKEDRMRIFFEECQRGLAAGQIVAFYKGQELFGGGVIVPEK